MNSIRVRMQRFRGHDATGPVTSLSILPGSIAMRLSRPLAERLARLRPARIGRSDSNRTPARLSDVEMAALLCGQVVAPGLIKIEQRLPLPWRHGCDRLRAIPAVDQASCARLRLPTHLAPEGFLLLDTETSGLAGGTGTIAFTVGLLQVTAQRLQLTQFIVLRPSAELALLEAVSVIAAQSKHLVTYNGKSFDLPLLRTRYRLAGLTDPFASHGHLDLVHWVRRMRPTQWPDARLGTIESRQFGLTRHQDLPGEAIPIAWQQWLRDGNATDLRRVPAHNRLDLLSLYGTLQIALMNRETDLFRPAGGATQGYREKTPPLQGDPRARLDYIHSILRAAGASREAKLV